MSSFLKEVPDVKKLAGQSNLIAAMNETMVETDAPQGLVMFRQTQACHNFDLQGWLNARCKSWPAAAKRPSSWEWKESPFSTDEILEVPKLPAKEGEKLSSGAEKIRKASEAFEGTVCGGKTLFLDASKKKRCSVSPPDCTPTSYVMMCKEGKIHAFGFREHLEVRGWFDDVNLHLMTLQREAFRIVATTPPRFIAELLVHVGCDASLDQDRAGIVVVAFVAACK